MASRFCEMMARRVLNSKNVNHYVLINLKQGLFRMLGFYVKLI